MEPFYILLSSEDSADNYPFNTPYDFITYLPETILLHGKWVCALTEITFPPISNTIPSLSLYVNSDLCDTTIVGARKIPILRRITGTPDNFRQEIITNPMYIPLKSLSFNTIRVYISTNTGEAASLLSQPVTCTVHFKPLKV